jgi:hypothetical protein
VHTFTELLSKMERDNSSADMRARYSAAEVEDLKQGEDMMMMTIMMLMRRRRRRRRRMMMMMMMMMMVMVISTMMMVIIIVMITSAGLVEKDLQRIEAEGRAEEACRAREEAEQKLEDTFGKLIGMAKVWTPLDPAVLPPSDPFRPLVWKAFSRFGKLVDPSMALSI